MAPLDPSYIFIIRLMSMKIKTYKTYARKLEVESRLVVYMSFLINI